MNLLLLPCLFIPATIHKSKINTSLQNTNLTQQTVDNLVQSKAKLIKHRTLIDYVHDKSHHFGLVDSLDNNKLTLEDARVIDVGQVTHVFDEIISDSERLSSVNELYTKLFENSIHLDTQILEAFYESELHNSSEFKYSKKQINQAPITEASKQLVKKLTQYTINLKNLVSFDKFCQVTTDLDVTSRLLLAAKLLYIDSTRHFRFKRAPVICLTDSTQLAVISGGYTLLDQSAKSISEAKHLAQNIRSKNMSLLTDADEVLLRELEYCAHTGQTNLAVRTLLAELDPDSDELTESAKKILVECCRWSEVPDDTRESLAVAWSPAELEAANNVIQQYITNSDNDNNNSLTDLTNLPAICIDTANTAFRDDAISLRPRSANGTRNKIIGNNKWEVLVHVVDVSDVYTERVLWDGAERRGVSRYDLGRPLHLLPPALLKYLSLAPGGISGPNTKKVNDHSSGKRCLTAWIYIDTNSGKVLDSGIEHSLITSQPVTFTYPQATKLLDTQVDDMDANGVRLKQYKIMLDVLEKIVGKWSSVRVQSSDIARKKEEKNQAKALVAAQQSQFNGNNRIENEVAYEFSRGFQLMNAALDLYSLTMLRTLNNAKVSIPRSPGSSIQRGGRVGTAPLRRYIDGMVQKQVLSAVFNYGGDLLSKEECKSIYEATAKVQRIQQTQQNNNNIRSNSKQKNQQISKKKKNTNSFLQQADALGTLERSLKDKNNNKRKKSSIILEAIGTGRGNEVTISGLGAVGRCMNMEELQLGERVNVQVVKIDSRKCILNVKRISG